MKFKYFLVYYSGAIYIPSYTIAFAMFVGHGCGEPPILMTLILIVSFLVAILSHIIEYFANKAWGVKDRRLNVWSFNDYKKAKDLENDN